jgi:hypothetical protein
MKEPNIGIPALQLFGILRVGHLSVNGYRQWVLNNIPGGFDESHRSNPKFSNLYFVPR